MMGFINSQRELLLFKNHVTFTQAFSQAKAKHIVRKLVADTKSKLVDLQLSHVVPG